MVNNRQKCANVIKVWPLRSKFLLIGQIVAALYLKKTNNLKPPIMIIPKCRTFGVGFFKNWRRLWMVPEMILAIEGPHPTSSNLQSFDSCNLLPLSLLKKLKWWENSQSDYGSEYILLQKWYFVSKIVLTYCEKIFF